MSGHAQSPSYDCAYTSRPILIDGKLDDPAWASAPWTSDFIDITGDAAKPPLFRTRVKMLWDDGNLYIAAELEEPDVRARLTQHDSVIFHDNDFEFFIKPLLTQAYYEFEMNALNTTWDLYLDKPYRLGGTADNSWEATGLKSAVQVQGTLNRSEDKDEGWTLEIALPLDAFQSRQQSVTKPVDGTVWRINFSRVEHLPGHLREDNWVWSPQGEVNMHIPEHWGYLRFHKDGSK